jgi:2',3'-cyclic-nucleotide 2'-phosphodiesterase (5'-nucleotidase family)
MLRHVALLLLAVLLLAPTARAAERAVQVTFALFGDIYEMEDVGWRGGYARMATAIKAERARARHVIVAHSGDTISPSLASSLDQGAHAIVLNNMLAPDLFVPGNHEYDFGEDVFRKRMSEAAFPLLAANLRSKDGARLERFEDWRMLELDGVRIAVIGLTADDSPVRSSPGSLRIAPVVETGRRAAAEARAAGADLVVALAHADRRTDLRLYYGQDFDLILSGDDHDLAVLWDGRTAFAEAMSDGAVLVAVDLDLRLTEDGDHRTLAWWPRFRIIDTFDVAPDPAVAERVAALKASLEKDLDVLAGTLQTPIDSRKALVRSREAAIGNLIADAMRAAAKADVAVVNGGSIRGDRTYEAGSRLTRRDVLTELPFTNKLVKVKLSGADLLRVLENGLWFAGKPNGRFLHVSGVEIRAKADAVPGSRILEAKVDGAPLDPARIYEVATNDFIAAGKEGYEPFIGAERVIREEDGLLVTTIVIDHIMAAGMVAPKIEGRIRIE